jgi:EamA domain-containing membrane protein RarD
MELFVLPLIAVILGFMIGCIGKKVTRLALLAITLAIPGLWYIAVSVNAPGGEKWAFAIGFGIPLAAAWAIAVVGSFLIARGRR